MKPVSLSSRSLRLAALLTAACTPVALLLPGCGGGGSNVFGGGSGTTQTSSLAGTVNIGTSQRGALSVQTFSNGTARGTLAISNAPVARQAQATTFTVGVYNLSGTVDESTGQISLAGNIPGFGAFSINVTPPTSTSAGSFVSTFGGETYTGTIPVTVPTTSPTANPTTGPTSAPTAGPTAAPGNVPLGSGPLTLSLTSSNSSLSGGNIVNGTGSTAVVDQVGGANRINLVVSNNALPPTLFNFLVSKTGTFKTGDEVTVRGDAGTSDLITLLVTNLSNPAASGSFRGQSGNFRITSVVGKRVNFTISNLRMVSQTSSASFNLTGSGSFTIN